MVKRVMMVAGEASGDLHGSAVVRALRQRVPDIEIFGIGGDAMRAEGMELVQHIRSLSFMGFVEVLKNLALIREVKRRLTMLLDRRRPDVVVLIDYPGFNLRFAADVKRHGIPVLYFISPQIWAWHKGRVKNMKRLVDRMMVVFPFEVDLYRKEGINVEFVGHPIVERIGSHSSREEFFRRHRFETGTKLLGLFPGSRLQELERILPVMAQVAGELRAKLGIQVGLGVAPNLGPEAVRRFLPADSGITLVENATYDLMHHADGAIVTSGTATLETGWFGTPMVVVYRTSSITYGIGRLLVDVPYIGLVNIVAGRKVVPELVQGELTPKRLFIAAHRLLTDEAYAREMRQQLSVIRHNLGEPGASRKVADSILALGSAV